jgi:Leucine-rich repeat (LRR) protein
MEDEDELIPEPDKKGVLSLTNRAWIHLDPVLWTFITRIVYLDLSYNNILDLPPNIGEMQVMREFRISFNKLKELPPEIGRIKRLRKLFINGNKLETLPTEIGRLEMLEELVASENELVEIPKTISLMQTLRVLKLQNNKLRMLPFELASIFTLEELDCSNNETLTMVPPKWRSDTDSVMFVCTVHRDYQIKMEEMLRTNEDLSKHSQFLEQEQLRLNETNQEIKFQLTELKKSIPKKVMLKIERNAKIDIELDGEDGGKSKKNENKGGCVIM